MAEKGKGKPLTYAGAGVDIDAGAEVVERIRAAVESTLGDVKVIGSLGGFAGLVESPRMENPVLVSATDGVGTKVMIAEAMNSFDTVGIDLVAMSVNDVITVGARPLFFLDYLATGRLEPEKAASLVESVAEGCRLAGCALLGGETAEMPDLYQGSDFDLAGFAVGLVEKDRIIDGSQVNEGDVVIGFPSSGIHSNGFSLVRKILEVNGVSYRDPLPEIGPGPIGDRLLVPTEIYAHQVAMMLEFCNVKAMAHITGGGLPENLPRVFPDGLCAEIDRSAWLVPRLFENLQKLGNVADAEMYRTFNMGIGFVAVVPELHGDRVCRAAVGAVPIGRIVKGEAKIEMGL